VLVLAALKEKRLDVANTWLQGALAARDTHHWNILEETVLLGLQQDVELQKFQRLNMSRFRSWPHWIWWSLLMGLVLVAVAGWHLRQQKVAPPPGAFIALLLPDQLDSHKYILAWQDAASEAGVSMAQITASELVAMDAAQRARIRGIVLPDSIHRSISAALAGVLEEYVRNGGALWINYDAAPKMPAAVFWTSLPWPGWWEWTTCCTRKWARPWCMATKC
jgi:hypothetical protein